MSPRHAERVQGWATALQAITVDIADEIDQLTVSSGAPRSALDKLGDAYELLEDACGLLTSARFALDPNDEGSDSEAWSAAITAAIRQGFGDPSDEAPA